MNSSSNKLASIFPHEQDTSQIYKIMEPITQKECLINGQIKKWNRPVQDVFSPIWIKTSTGHVQKLLESYPLLTEKEAGEIPKILEKLQKQIEERMNNRFINNTA